MLSAVIFDVDGTLVDSVDFHAAAWQKAFEQFGHRFDLRDIRGQIGKGGDQLLSVFLDEREIESRGEEIEDYRTALFKREYRPLVRGFSGSRPLLDRLRSDGIKVALGSSAKGDELKYYRKVAEIQDLDLVETSSDDAERSKPHPDIFQAALKRLDLPAEQCVVVGDTPYDAEAAGKAGLRTTGVLCGGFAEADLRAAGADLIFVGPADLLNRYEWWLEELGR